jgi:hypothetical protein
MFSGGLVLICEARSFVSPREIPTHLEGRFEYPAKLKAICFVQKGTAPRHTIATGCTIGG